MASTAGVPAETEASQHREATLDAAAAQLVSGVATACEACGEPMTPADVARLSPRPLCLSCEKA
jgi:formylmethanofuran dehydrogenase subunit E